MARWINGKTRQKKPNTDHTVRSGEDSAEAEGNHEHEREGRCNQSSGRQHGGQREDWDQHLLLGLPQQSLGKQ